MQNWMQPINGFMAQPKADGSKGVDYFQLVDTGGVNKKIPTTREMYASYTGVDPGQVEDLAASWYEANKAGSETTPTNNTGGTGTGTDTTDKFQPVTYDDGTGSKIYYTPEDYAAAVNRKITSDYNDSVKQIENNFKNGFISIDQRDDEIKKTRTALIKKKDEDLQSVSGYFNAISPDAVQSGRNKMEGRAVEDYTTNNKALGSELGANLYGADGRIRQDLSVNDLQPYMTELSDTGNLARTIAGNYITRDTNKQAANTAFNSGLTQNANDYIGSKPAAALPSSYSDYLNNKIISGQKSPQAGVGSFSSVKKTDKYGNPIDEYMNA